MAWELTHRVTGSLLWAVPVNLAYYPDGSLAGVMVELKHNFKNRRGCGFNSSTIHKNTNFLQSLYLNFL